MKNKLVATSVAVLPALGLLAQGEGSSSIDLSAAENAATTIGTAVSGLITGNVLTAVLTVVGASLAIWAVFLVVRYIRKGGK